VTQRPADLLEPELQKLADELDKLADEHRFTTNGIDDVLTYALFPQIGLKFLRHRGDPSAFEPPPDPAAAAKAAAPAKAPAPAATAGPERYSVTVNGRAYDVVVAAGGEIEHVEPMEPAKAASAPASSAPAAAVEAPLSGTIFKVVAKPGQSVAENDLLIVLEAMKMETEVRAPRAGQVATIDVREGDSVELGATLLTLS
jgi:oxaloacetate decarboxylase alpha subunit